MLALLMPDEVNKSFTSLTLPDTPATSGPVWLTLPVDSAGLCRLRAESRTFWHARAVRFVLVHSPLVGPATWRGVAEVLASLGHAVDVPDLRHAAKSGDPRTFISAARSAVSPDTGIVVGHSGAGFFLPSIAASREQLSLLVFVDAGIPPFDGTATASADFLGQLRSIAVNGMLPRWSRWWGEGVFERLVPDRERRSEVEAELLEVPLAFYETAITVPDGWCTAPGGFVLLSEMYRGDAATAMSLGWPTVELLGTHLDIVNHPEALAQALTRLARGDR